MKDLEEQLTEEQRKYLQFLKDKKNFKSKKE